MIKNVYKELLELKDLIGYQFKLEYVKPHPTSNNSSPARFYGLPKIHIASILLKAILLGCAISVYILDEFLTKILQLDLGNNLSFLKDSKDVEESRKKCRSKLHPSVFLCKCIVNQYLNACSC